MPLPSYAVKHQVSKDNPSLSSNIATIRVTPYSYTSNLEGKLAAKGEYIYVIETRYNKKTKTTYWLGYKYRAFNAEERLGGLKWNPTGKKEFKYKNTAKIGSPAQGFYFKEPVEIKDSMFINWYLEATWGMLEIKAEFIPVLDKLFEDPSNDAQEYEF